jgi:hypothetical protein
MQYNLQQNPEIFQNIHALPGSKRNLWKIIQTTQTTTKNLIEKEVLQVF